MADLEESDQLDNPSSEAAAGGSFSGIALKKSSSRDYSRVICETLTYTSGADGILKNNKIERQGSIRSGNPSSSGSSSTRYVSSKRSYLGHHIFGCFPSRSRRTSLHLIPKLVLADEMRSGAVAAAAAAATGFRCGSSKGGPAFTRVPADAARGSYSEPTSPQVTCIGQVKARSKAKNPKVGKPPNPSSSSGNASSSGSRSVLLKCRSRGSVSSPLSGSGSGAPFARSNSRRRDGEDDVLANVSSEICSSGCTSYEIDLESGDEAKMQRRQQENVKGDEPKMQQQQQIVEDQPTMQQQQRGNEEDESKMQQQQQEQEYEEDESKMRNEEGESETEEAEEESARPSPNSATIARHRRLAMEVCQALAAADPASNTRAAAAAASSEDDQDQDQHHEDHEQRQRKSKAAAVAAAAAAAAAAVTLKRLDSIHDSSPRACLWMRRSIGRPISLDLSRKQRAAATGRA